MSDVRDDDPLFTDWRRQGAPVSIIATLGGVLFLGLLAYFAPNIEGMVRPIFADNEIPMSSVTRVGQKVCWTRVGFKNYAPMLDDIDVDVDYISQKTGKLAHQPTPALYAEDTGEELTSDDLPPAGKKFERRVCLNLSNKIAVDQPIRIRQIALFQSVTGLYDVSVTFPVIVFPPDAAQQFSKRHDIAETPSAVAGPKPSAPSQRSDADTLDDVRKGLAEMERQPEAPSAPIADRFPVHVDTTLSEQDAARVEQSRQEHGDPSRRATLRRLIPRGLDGEDRDALGPYDPGRK